MKIYFTHGDQHSEPRDQRRDRFTGVPVVPEAVLDRHRARVLRPRQAVLAPGFPVPGGTIYRYDRLLLTGGLADDRDGLGAVRAALADHGMRLDVDDRGSRASVRGHRRAAVKLGDRTAPASMDSWQVLQALRTAAVSGRYSADLLGKVRLEHPMFGAKGGPGIDPLTGQPERAGPGHLASLGRIPVDMVIPMPVRCPASYFPGGRRLRIAVLDTGITPHHPALDVSECHDNRDTFVTIDSAFQELLTVASDPACPIIDGPWDTPVTDDSLIGEVATGFGHGTFITGIIRQTAPDIQVHSIRLMHNDGVVYENDLIIALTHLASETERARDGDPDAQPLDIIILPFGYVDEGTDRAPTGDLADLIDQLTRLGVVIVAAAGNESSSLPFYPAAFAARDRDADAAPIISVGALNPNGSVAMFSNDGPWVTCFATGATVVSTFPTYAAASRSPGHRTPTSHDGTYRETLDPDDFTSGYALWSGTSFAAALAAGKLAVAINEMPTAQDTVFDTRAVIARVHDALKTIGG